MENNPGLKKAISFGGLAVKVTWIGVAFLLLWLLIVAAFLISWLGESGPDNVPILDGDIEYISEINAAAQKHKVDAALIAAIIKQESDFNPEVLSPAGAVGLMQLMPDNCKEHGLDWKSTCKDPEKNINAGTSQIAGYLKDYKNDLVLALAAYNAGPGNVEKYNGVPPFAETENYVIVVPQLYKEYSEKYGKEVIKAGDGGKYYTGKEFLWPANGPLTSGYGMRWGTMHNGIDIGAPEGSPIVAAAEGTVTLSAHDHPDGFGWYVIVDHGNGTETWYGHMYKETVSVKVGQKVTRGQKIAKVGNNGGSTGPHLHLEVRIKGNPVDPMKYFKKAEGGT